MIINKKYFNKISPVSGGIIIEKLPALITEVP